MPVVSRRFRTGAESVLTLAQVVARRGLVGSPMAPLPGKRPRFEPRNLAFANGLDRWDLDSRAGYDYSATAEGLSAVLSSAVSRPAGVAPRTRGSREVPAVTSTCYGFISRLLRRQRRIIPFWSFS